MTREDANLAVAANVMLVEDSSTGIARTEKEQAAFSPGDLAAVQNAKWNPLITQGLTPVQLIEYRIYLPCLGCGRIAGLCRCKAR